MNKNKKKVLKLFNNKSILLNYIIDHILRKQKLLTYVFFKLKAENKNIKIIKKTFRNQIKELIQF